MTEVLNAQGSQGINGFRWSFKVAIVIYLLITSLGDKKLIGINTHKKFIHNTIINDYLLLINMES